ncbi:MAG: FUSC family protein [Nitrosomonadales bacterium]|nr:FUSC family protein [Nitrosomonadales bacterium]
MPIPLIAAALSAIAPQLAQRGLDLLSGVFRGALDQGADKVTQLIKEKTGIDVHDVAENKLTEEQWVKLKEFELQHQDQLLAFRQAIDTHELEMERLRVEDSKSARDTQSGRDKNEDTLVRRFAYYYAYLITALTFLFVFMAIFAGPTNPQSPAWRVIDTMLGFLLGTGLSAIIQFFYGSSQGSQQKSDQLKELTKQLSVNQANSEGVK